MAILFSCTLVFAFSASAANIDGTVQSTTKKYATVTTKSNAMPRPGDKANIYFKIPGGNVEVSVATAHVYEITGRNIMLQIDQATGAVAKNQLVRINSPHPILPDGTPSSSPSPNKSQTPSTNPSPSPPPSKPNPAAGANNLSGETKRLLGKWQGPQHTTQFFANGTYVVDPDKPGAGVHGNWRIKGDELIRSDTQKGIVIVKIVSLTDNELVVRDEKNATYHLKHLP